MPATPDLGSTARVRRPEVTSALGVFRAACLRCHDADGRGESSRDLTPTIPDFTDSRWQRSRRDHDLSRSILEGKGKAMPRMKRKLGPLDVSMMVAFVRAFEGGNQLVPEEAQPTAPAGNSPAPASGEQPRTLGSTYESSQLRSAGAQFQRFCARCHGGDGRGTAMRESLASIPDFTFSAWQASRDDHQLAASVLAGKGTAMPGFHGKLGREQIRELIAFVRQFNPNAGPVANSAPDGFEQRYQQLLMEFEEVSRQIRALDVPPRHVGSNDRGGAQSRGSGRGERSG
jgi:mono/diheme cytochrome c family protein